MSSRLAAEGVTLGYHGRPVIDDLDFDVPDGKITAIVGPNACGKSTLLRGLARILRPEAGRIVLDGQSIHALPTNEVARRLGLLPQGAAVPAGLTVADLVSRGRSPHQSFFQQWSERDQAAVEAALAATKISDLADRRVDELSGGQRQKVWIAMALAQETDLLLLDEPTTFLDLAHQIAVLDLIQDLNQNRARTIVVVIHDLNLASRYAHHLVVMAEGTIVASGSPREVITAQTISEVFGVDSMVVEDPAAGTPMVVPVSRPAGPARPPMAPAFSSRLDGSGRQATGDEVLGE